ncbi:MAG: hypothetical protein M1421_04975 [Candidatus Eremiobacteraeota bacterium]|nr:hypothetical protein [Candidatus Eremiobacteraeota bacterium]MCL5055654.1 hypothetical protein [Bacillota bacterium]
MSITEKNLEERVGKLEIIMDIVVKGLEEIKLEIREGRHQTQQAIQTLHQEIQDSKKETQQAIQTLHQEIQDSKKETQQAIQTLHQEVSETKKEIQESKKETQMEMRALNTRIDILHSRMDTWLRWILGFIFSSWLTTMLSLWLKK